MIAARLFLVMMTGGEQEQEARSWNARRCETITKFEYCSV